MRDILSWNPYLSNHVYVTEKVWVPKCVVSIDRRCFVPPCLPESTTVPPWHGNHPGVHLTVHLERLISNPAWLAMCSSLDMPSSSIHVIISVRTFERHQERKG